MNNTNYTHGLELQVVHMSHPAVSEDGVLVSRSALQKMKFNVFEKRTIECGNGAFPLNLYGAENNHRLLPDIGDLIRNDNV